MFVLLYRLCEHVRLRILATSLCVYVFFAVECMYICKTGHFGNDILCSYLCCCRGYLIGYLLVSVFGLILRFNECTELVFWYWKVLND